MFLQNVLINMLSCDILITSSLHGLIVGEAYSIPTIFVEFGSKLYGGLFKLEVCFNSTDREIKFIKFFRRISVKNIIFK